MLCCVYKMEEDERGKRVAHTSRREIHTAHYLGNPKEGVHLEDLDTEGRMILKLIFQK